MANEIAVINNGIGNIRSVTNALCQIGAEYQVVSQPEKLDDFSHIILPGVGAFKQAMENLKRTGMQDALDEQVSKGTPILGICLGMQLMCNSSQEGGVSRGLGWIDAEVVQLPETPDLRMIHIGWNELFFDKAHPLVDGLENGVDVYFVHSFRVCCNEPGDVLASSNYGAVFTAMFARDNLFGIQFHPEKSQRAGLQILSNFIKV